MAGVLARRAGGVSALATMHIRPSPLAVGVRAAAYVFTSSRYPSRLLQPQRPGQGWRLLSASAAPKAEHKYSFKENKSGKSGGGRFGELVREYGPLSILVYAFFSSITFVSCLASIYAFGVDRATVKRWLDGVKRAVGFKPSEEVKADEVPESGDNGSKSNNRLLDALPAVLKTDAVVTLATNVVLAMVMTKMFLPIKLTLVAFVTPVVARRLRVMGFNFGQRGAYREAARDVRDMYKDRVKKL
ncbi:hypothetical protein HDU82_005782 [Entophlyctis luteolus]|nr:hypothetical protein HDU82_005782 [Entophlyctis luteolus]